MAASPTRRSTRPFQFRPPRNNPFFIGAAKIFLPLALRWITKIVTVEVSDEDLGRLQSLKGSRVILTPNHAGRIEPMILFHLSKLLGQEFNYLAAKETFERPAPLGWLAQRLGAYSIVRGTPDINAFRMTRQLLREGKRWLVVFPEGEVCYQNDTVMPFQQGVAQLAFWACEDLAKREEPPPIYFVPIAIKYIYLRDMGTEIDRSLTRLEQRLFSEKASAPLALYDRLRRVGEAVLSTNEREYNVRVNAQAPLDERVQRIKELIVERVATLLGVRLRSHAPLIERIRDLFNAVERVVFSEAEGTGYESQLRQHRQREAESLYHDLCKVLRFVAVYDGYVRETLTPERFLDVLGLLEWELCGRQKYWGPRKAVVRIGQPVNLATYWTRYRSDKRGTLHEVTLSLESSVREMLSALAHLVHPIVSPS